MDAAGFGEPKKKINEEKKADGEKKPNEAKSPAK
jgi:hypothetical protein